MHDLQTQTDEETETDEAEVAMEKFAPPALPPLRKSEYKAMVKFSKEKKKQELEKWAERDYQVVMIECNVRAFTYNHQRMRNHCPFVKATPFRPLRREWCVHWK